MMVYPGFDKHVEGSLYLHCKVFTLKTLASKIPLESMSSLLAWMHTTQRWFQQINVATIIIYQRIKCNNG